MIDVIEWVLPLEIQSPNKKSWKISPRTQAGIASSKRKKNDILLSTSWASEFPKPLTPCIVKIQRLYNPSLHQKRWDDDNWIAGCKSIRDSIAALLIPGLARGQADDKKHGISWQYDQVVATRKGVRIIIQSPPEENATP